MDEKKLEARAHGMLPGVAGICMFMLVLTLINAFAALRGSYGEGRGKYGVLMLAANLGDEFVVWDKAASIRYRKPGKGRVRAEFRLTEEKLAEIRGVVAAEGRYDARFLVEIRDEAGGVVAVVERVIYCATKTAHEERAKLRSGTG